LRRAVRPQNEGAVSPRPWAYRHEVRPGTASHPHRNPRVGSDAVLDQYLRVAPRTPAAGRVAGSAPRRPSRLSCRRAPIRPATV